MSGVLYLGPHEIDLVHFGLVALHPPEPILEERSDHDRVISFTYRILINHSAIISDASRLSFCTAGRICFRSGCLRVAL